MVTFPRQRVQEVHLKCRFCAYQHFNTRNKGTNIPHYARPAYGRNVPSYVLAQLRWEARRTAFEIGALNPDRCFEY